MLAQVKQWLLLALLFLLPWQTRLIYQTGELNGVFWEYGTLSLFVTELLLWAGVVLQIAEFFVVRRAVDRTGQKKRLGVVVIVVIAATLFLLRSPLPEVTQQFLIWLLGMASVAVILLTRRDSAPYWWAFWWGGVVQAVVGIGQFIMQHVVANKWLGLAEQSGVLAGSGVVETAAERWLRAYGSWGGPNPFGSYLAIVLVIGCLLYVRQIGWKRSVLLVGQSVVVLGLFLSFSRGAWLATIVGLLAACAVQQRKKQVVKMIGVMATVVAVWLVCLYPLVSARVAANGRLEALSVNTRQSQYVEAWNVWKHNALFGVGPRLYTYSLAHDFGVVKYQPIHNTFVLMVVELGSVFGLLVLGILGHWVYWVWKNNPLALPLVVVFLVAGMFEHFFWSLWPGLLLTGVIIGFSLNKKLPT